MPVNADDVSVTVRTNVDPVVLAEHANNLNWKDHPKRQKNYIKDSVKDAGWVKSAIFCANTMRMLDGHGRTETAIEEGYTSVPVDIGWWTVEQGNVLLASLDPMTQMSTVDANALQSLTLATLKDRKGKRKKVSMLKDVNAFAKNILDKKKDRLGIRQSKRSIDKLIGSSETTTRDKRERETDNDQLYDTALRDDLLFPSETNAFGIPDLLPSKLYTDTILPTGTFARDGSPLLDSMFYCHNSRPFDSANHLKPIGGFLGFYCDDKAFESVYSRAAHNAERLVDEKWTAILEPDFSTYWDWPYAKRLWSVYRSRWCARYWQQLGMSIIPIIRRTNDLKRDEWLYSSLPEEVPIAAMQLRMGGKKNTQSEQYWNGVGAVLKYMVEKKGLKHVMFHGGKNLEKYVTGFLPKKLEYTLVIPFIDARRKSMK